ncbi:MAG: hypothetical protein AAGD43_27090 [Pseudomonadota bacterium]
MSSMQKYLEALEGKASHQQPVATQAQQNHVNGSSHNIADDLALRSADHTSSRNASNTSADFDMQLVSEETAERYIWFLERSPPTQYNPGFQIYDASFDWDTGAPPLTLTEFLAYKSALAYYRPAIIEKNLYEDHPHGITEFRFFEARESIADTQAYGFVLDETAYLIFRGTEFFTLKDWSTDFDSVQTTELSDERKQKDGPVIGPLEPSRHTGFAIAWGSVRDDIERWLDRLIRDRLVKRTVFSGHSLGGALAKLAAFHFANHPENSSEGYNRKYNVGAVITFGAPTVGGSDFKQTYESIPGLKNRTIRVEASLDAVSLATMLLTNYEHVGRSWSLDKRPAYSRWRMMFFTPLIDPKKWSDDKKSKQSEKPRTEGKSITLRGILFRLLFTVLWFLIRLARRANAAHSMNQTYVLFLTVLSYQGLRRHLTNNGQVAARDRQAYDRAYKRLLDHLAYVRGRNGRLFGVAKNGPIKVETRQDEAQLTRRFEHFII